MALPLRTRTACLRWYPVRATNSSKINLFSAAVLCRYRSATAVTSSCRVPGLIVDIVASFGSRNCEATMVAR